MTITPRPQAFILSSTDHGPLILNRHDVNWGPHGAYGVGHQLLAAGCYDLYEVASLRALLGLRRQYHGPGVVMLDGGANIGVHTVECAKLMTGWGSVIAVEAQERIFYALAGNVALNNCFNASVRWAALGGECGEMDVPVPDYHQPASFGSLELRQTARSEYIGQVLGAGTRSSRVPVIHIDGLSLPRLDLLKLDVEGMELEVLHGASATLSRCRPIVSVEHIKSDCVALTTLLEQAGYRVIRRPMMLLGLHRDDPCNVQVTVRTEP